VTPIDQMSAQLEEQPQQDEFTPEIQPLSNSDAR
jgi:hypothetical protein